MWYNYFKIALRNITKGRLHSAINIIGLSVGAAVCMLIMLFITDEWSYDEFHSKSDRIYRAWVKEHYKGDIFFNTVTPYILAPELKENFAEIETVTHYATINSLTRKANFSENELIHLADPEFFDVFDFKLVQGKKDQVLNGLNQVVITPEIGKKYFGDAAPLGEILAIQVAGEWTDFTISGIIERPPSNSSLQYDILIPYENVKLLAPDNARKSWTIVAVETFALLKKGINVKDVESKIAPFIDEKVSRQYKPGEYVVGLQPLTDIHLNTEFPLGIIQVSDARYPRILFGIALLIMLLACINFTTISIGKSVSRAREVGIRKVSGSTRGQLMLQFWSEAILISIIAILIGVALAALALPYFNSLADKSLVLSFSLQNILLFGGLAVATGLVAGVYPALVLSSFGPIKSLRDTVSSSGSGKHSILRFLVGAQYVLSVGLIICTLVMQNQMRFLQNKNMGYNQEHIVTLNYDVSGQRLSEMWADASQVLERMRQQLQGNRDIKEIAMSSHLIGTPGWSRVGFTEQSSDRFRKFNQTQISPNYLDMMDISLVDGRNFHQDVGTDSKSAIINKAMADEWQMEDPIGHPLPGPFKEYTIIGVTEDYHFASLHTPVAPLVMTKDFIPLLQAAPDHTAYDGLNPKISIKLSSNLSASLTALEEVWKDVAGEQTFAYTFLDDNIARQYEAESRLSTILKISTLLAIFIACLGLFGIGILIISERTKEIGVRKILGASTGNIVLMLNKHFTMIVLIATALAVPIAWYVMDGWLEDFAYRISISPLIFLIAGVLALVLAWISVGYQSIRAASSNPVDSLRAE